MMPLYAYRASQVIHPGPTPEESSLSQFGKPFMIEGGAAVVVVVAVVAVTLQNVVQSKVAVLTADQGPWLWRL